MKEWKKPVTILKVGERGQNINLSEIYKIIEPMDKNPSSCETYEKILSSKKVLKLVEKNGFRWAVALAERMSSAHTSHDNFNLHNK